LRILRRLQDNLGEFQDYHIHIDLLGETRSALIVSKLLEEAAEEAIMELIKTLDRQQADSRKRFHKRFVDFSNDRHQRLFKKLFRE
jgi:CHAD domain-containing protein